MRPLTFSVDVRLKEAKLVSRKRGIKVDGSGVRTQTTSSLHFTPSLEFSAGGWAYTDTPWAQKQ